MAPQVVDVFLLGEAGLTKIQIMPVPVAVSKASSQSQGVVLSRDAVKALNKRPRTNSNSSDDGVVQLARPSVKRVKQMKEMTAFFELLEDPYIFEFLSADRCKLVADKYLLAMVFTYFKRAGFTIEEYNRLNFFTALYLASDIEEDEEEHKFEIFPWALGRSWRSYYIKFLQNRDQLWARIGFRAVVSRESCEEIFQIDPTHWSWSRQRAEHHAGAIRAYTHGDDSTMPRGPYTAPRVCPKCDSLAEL